MNKKLSKVILGKICIECIIILMMFVAIDRMTAPSENTRLALLAAVNKKVLDAAPLVEVTSTIRSAGFLAFAVRLVALLVFALLCSELWMLWRHRAERIWPSKDSK
jgi:hypothetical protein